MAASPESTISFLNRHSSTFSKISNKGNHTDFARTASSSNLQTKVARLTAYDLEWLSLTALSVSSETSVTKVGAEPVYSIIL